MYAPLEAVDPGAEAVPRPILGRPVNIGLAERWGSLAAGAALSWAGIRRRSAYGLLMTLGGGYLIHRGYTGRCGVYQTLGIATTSEPVTAVQQQVTVAGSPESVYRFWRESNNLPRFIKHLGEVSITAARNQCWTVRLPAGLELKWESAVVDDRENERIAWESLPGGSAETAGEVRFRPAPGDRGTEIHVRLEYRWSAGLFGDTAARLTRPIISEWLKEDLRRFKRLFETGEIPTTEGQSSARIRPKPEQLGCYVQPAATLPHAASLTADDDRVSEASAESFPASDAPGWTTSSVGAAS